MSAKVAFPVGTPTAGAALGGPISLRERPQYASQYASRLRPPAAAENRRNCSRVSPRAGRLPSGRGPNADRPFDEPATSTARRVAAPTWMMSSTTVASRAYAVVPARRSRWSRRGASRPGSAPAAGSARHRADASRRDRAARTPDPQPASCRRPFRRGFRARAAPSTRHRWCRPRPDQQPLSGCAGRDGLAGARVPNPGPAAAGPVRVRSRSSPGLRWTRGGLWHRRRQHRPLHTGLGSGDRCKGRRFAARRMYVAGILSSQLSQACLPSHGTVTTNAHRAFRNEFATPKDEDASGILPRDRRPMCFDTAFGEVESASNKFRQRIRSKWTPLDAVALSSQSDRLDLAGAEGGCQIFDLYKFRSCGITLA